MLGAESLAEMPYSFTFFSSDSGLVTVVWFAIIGRSDTRPPGNQAAPEDFPQTGEEPLAVTNFIVQLQRLLSGYKHYCPYTTTSQTRFLTPP